MIKFSFSDNAFTPRANQSTGWRLPAHPEQGGFAGRTGSETGLEKEGEQSGKRSSDSVGTSLWPGKEEDKQQNKNNVIFNLPPDLLYITGDTGQGWWLS